MSDEGGEGGDPAIAVGGMHGCIFDVLARDLLACVADLVIVALWANDLVMPTVSVGELDAALGGALKAMLGDRIFRGDVGDTLFLSSPPSAVAARAVMMLGIGPRSKGSDAQVRHALQRGTQQAILLEARHVAFAPMLLGNQIGRLPGPRRMEQAMRGIGDALRTRPAYIERWSFVADGADPPMVTELLRTAIRRITGE